MLGGEWRELNNLVIAALKLFNRFSRLGLFSLATIASGVFPLFLPLAITAFGAPEGYFILALRSQHSEHLSSLSPNTITLRKTESKESRLLI